MSTNPRRRSLPPRPLPDIAASIALAARWSHAAQRLVTRQALAGAVLATAAAGTCMALLRWNLQVRTVPERVLEWVLTFIPLGLFEAGIQRFGFDAKRYALYASAAGMLAILAGLGTVALRRNWSWPTLAALGLGLWLFIMLIVMPLTSAGYFATSLPGGTGEAVWGHLAVALTYSAILVMIRPIDARVPSPSPGVARRGHPISRRPALLLAGGAVSAFGATLLLNRLGPTSMVTRVVVHDPQEPWPSGGTDPPQPHPNPTALPTNPEPVSASLSEARSLVRDKDGAILPSGRRPGELASVISHNDDFYVVTKNAVWDPKLPSDKWRLVVDGEVARPIQIDYESLRRLPSLEVTKTLECISNFVAKCELAPFGCDLISTAQWKGARVADVLELAGGVKSGAVALATIAADEFTTELPIEAALDPETLLVYEMNGQPLPAEHGYPARLLVPGRYGMKSAKWVVTLRPVAREFIDWYGQRNWSKRGIVKTMTRIDVPAPGASLLPGEHRIAGIAYAGDRGIERVEFSSDGGARWQAAELLEPQVGRDAWVRWQGRFTLPPGTEATLMSRAIDGTGEMQTEEFSLPQPDGSSGWHEIHVRSTTA